LGKRGIPSTSCFTCTGSTHLYGSVISTRKLGEWNHSIHNVIPHQPSQPRVILLLQASSSSILHCLICRINTNLGCLICRSLGILHCLICRSLGILHCLICCFHTTLGYLICICHCLISRSKKPVVTKPTCRALSEQPIPGLIGRGKKCPSTITFI